jgi:hypothetical protein
MVIASVSTAADAATRTGDDLALDQQALHLGVDQPFAKLVEIEDADDERGQRRDVENGDTPGEAGEQRCDEPAQQAGFARVVDWELVLRLIRNGRSDGSAMSPNRAASHRCARAQHPRIRCCRRGATRSAAILPRAPVSLLSAIVSADQGLGPSYAPASGAARRLIIP